MATVRINVAKVQAKEAERKAKVKPLPTVSVKHVGTIKSTDLFDRASALVTSKIRESVDMQFLQVDEKHRLLEELQNERIRVLKERNILSSQNWRIVDAVEAKLRAESTSLAIAFLDGDLPSEDLADHAAKIEALTDQGAKIYDDIRYVELHGKLPNNIEEIPSQKLTEDVKAIQYTIRRLDDRICKTQKKIRDNRAKNPSRIAIWNEKIAYDEAQRTELKHKLKKLEYEARSERLSEG